MSRTVVQMLKEFLDRVLAIQFVGALLRKGKGMYIFVDTYRAMTGKLSKFFMKDEKLKLFVYIISIFVFLFSDVVLTGQPEDKWNAIVAELRKSVSVVLSNAGKWRSRYPDSVGALEIGRIPEPRVAEGASDMTDDDTQIQAILNEVTELIAPELLTHNYEDQ